MAKKQHYMTYDERCKLEAYLRAKKSVAWIARELGFSERTIYYEKKRGLYTRIKEIHGYDREIIIYSADKAQMLHDYNQTAKGRPLKIGNDRAFADFLEHKILDDRYSPAAALAMARRERFHTMICTSTLYSYIDKQIFLHLTNKDLWTKGKRQKRKYRKVQRIAHPLLPSISNRPDEINQRQEYGHWELDLIIGKKQNKDCLMTLTERKARQEMIFKLPDHKAATIRNIFDELERTLPDFREKFRSITTDNGSEFLEYDKLCSSIHGGQRFQVWYCHSFASWEKGSNENHNRMIRRWFPKGTDFSIITKEEVAAVQNWMNGYPRKILDWKTPMEITA